MADFRIERVTHYGPGMQVPPPVGPGDRRIPPPAPDLINMELGSRAPALILPDTVSNKREEIRAIKFGIYATKGDKFIFAALDEDNDPMQSVNVEALTIEHILKPMLEIAGHKVVNYAGMDYTEAATKGAVRPLRKQREAS